MATQSDSYFIDLLPENGTDERSPLEEHYDENQVCSETAS